MPKQLGPGMELKEQLDHKAPLTDLMAKNDPA